MIKEEYIGLKDSEFIPLTEGIPREALNLFEINKSGEVRSVSDNKLRPVLKYSHSHVIQGFVYLSQVGDLLSLYID